MPFLPTRGLGEVGDGTLSTLLVTRGLGGLNPPPLISAFQVLGATQIGQMVVRVTFSDTIQRVDPTSTTDALYVAGWTTTGSTAVTLEVVLPVPDDPFSVDLFYRAAFIAGTWTVEASSSLLSLDGDTIVLPRSATFVVAARVGAAAIAIPAPDSRVLRKHLNGELRGRAWNSLIIGADNRDQETWGLARAARDQLYVGTASGEFLLQRAGDRGLDLPATAGLSDDAYRALALALTTRRITTRAVHDLLEAFYGPGATRAAAAAMSEPYELQDGDVLMLRLGERRDVLLTFARTDALRIARATADEVAAAVNRGLRAAAVGGYAEVLVDAAAGTRYVQLYADARGLPSSLRVLGGAAQVALRFPEALFPTAAAPFGFWDIAASPDNPGQVRFTLTAPTAYDLSQVVEGDVVLVYGEEFSTAVRGTHEITAVYVAYPGGTLEQWFEVAGAFAQSAVTQSTWKALVFQRPQLLTVHDNPRRAYATQAPGRGVDITLPTTSPAVERGAGRAAYVHAREALEVTAAERDGDGLVTVTTAVGHGLTARNLVFMDGVEFGVTPPAVTAGASSGTLGAGFF